MENLLNFLNLITPLFLLLPSIALIILVLLVASMGYIKLAKNKNSTRWYYKIAIKLRQKHKTLGLTALALMLCHALFFATKMSLAKVGAIPYFGILNLVFIFLAALSAMQVAVLRKTTPYDAKATKKAIALHLIFLTCFLVSLVFHRAQWFGL